MKTCPAHSREPSMMRPAASHTEKEGAHLAAPQRLQVAVVGCDDVLVVEGGVDGGLPQRHLFRVLVHALVVHLRGRVTDGGGFEGHARTQNTGRAAAQTHETRVPGHKRSDLRQPLDS